MKTGIYLLIFIAWLAIGCSDFLKEESSHQRKGNRHKLPQDNLAHRHCDGVADDAPCVRLAEENLEVVPANPFRFVPAQRRNEILKRRQHARPSARIKHEGHNNARQYQQPIICLIRNCPFTQCDTLFHALYSPSSCPAAMKKAARPWATPSVWQHPLRITYPEFPEPQR